MTIDAVTVNQRSLSPPLVVGVLLFIALLYWPITRGGLAWDDSYLLHEAWLHADSWTSFIFRGFSVWVSYFRPLGAALLVAETRAFDGAPQPMHVVSLGLHLINTTLVGLLAIKLQPSRDGSFFTAPAAMLFYGLHSALIEPVSWLGCHYELAVVFFTLLGLLANATIASQTRRAIAVAGCFLAALGFKEAAAAFPLLLLLLDVAAAPGTVGKSLRQVWRRQRIVYVATCMAAAIYVVARIWALGYALSPSALEPLLSWERLQKICATYLHYWNLVLWPMSDIGPIHPYSPGQFAQTTVHSIALDVSAASVLVAGLWAFIRRLPIGSFILAVTIALLPVLNIVPLAFSESLYHDRYAASAVALACALGAGEIFDAYKHWRPLARAALAIVALAWLGFAIANIRVTVPLWADELGLWKWALREHPDSIDIKQHLLASYIERGLRMPARDLADAIVAGDVSCPYCMLNAADLALADKDAERARAALAKLGKMDVMISRDRRLLRGFVFASGELRELQNDPERASTAYRQAISLEPSDPLPRMALAYLLARRGDDGAARAEAAVAFPLFAPAEREVWRQRFEHILTSPVPTDK